MASWTDSIIQFTPYVQQLPVDAMVKVGMQKQAQYDQGVQKIQGYINNIAGMDVSRDVDRQHLQSKLDELGSKLKTVAAGDFSNQQLVNSVGGMATQIVKDPFVQAAVYSTAKIREQEKIKKQLEKEGKTDRNNDEYYNNMLQGYYSAGIKDANGKPISFNGEYIPYTDIVKKMKEAVANAGEDSSIVEQLYITEPGSNKPKMFYENRKDPKTGQLISVPVGYRYADVKTIEKLTTNKPAVMAALSNVFQQGDVKQQLQIDGWANYRNVPVEHLIEPFKKTFEDQNLDLTNKGVEISAQLAGTNLSKEDRERLNQMLTQINRLKLENSQNFNQLTEQSLKNPEAFKQNLYETQYKQNLLRQFTKEKSELSTGVNEGKQQENWEKTYNFNVQKEATDIAQKNRAYNLQQSEYQLKKLQVMSGLVPDPTSPTGFRPLTDAEKKAKPVTPRDVVFNAPVPGEKPNSVEIVEGNIASLGNAKISSARDIYKDVLSMYHKRPVSDEEVMGTIKNGARLTGETEDAWVLRQVKKLNNSYAQLGINPDPVINNKLNKFNETDKAHLSAILGYEVVKERAKKGKPISINNITVEPGDVNNLVEFNKLQGEITAAAAFKQLPPKTSGRYTELKNKLENKYGSLIGWFGGKNYNAEVLNNYLETVNKELEPLVGVTDKITGGLSPDEKTRFATSDNLAALTLGNRAAGANSPEGKYDSETFMKYLNDPKSKISWVIQKPKNQFEDWNKGEIMVTDGDGNRMSFEATKEEIESLSNNKFQSFIPTPINDRLSVFKTGSTNPSKVYTDPNAWQSSYFKKEDANPALQKAGIEYHADVVPIDNGYKLAHYIKLPGEKNFSLHWDNNILTGTREELELKAQQYFLAATPAAITLLAKSK